MVALAGTKARPPIAAPGPLKPYLRFQRLPDRAVAEVRKVVDADEPFRVRVAQVATEETVGRAGLAWLRRTLGWQAELEAMLASAAEAAAADEAARAERDATRRVDAAEAAMRRAVAEAAAARAESDSLRAELDDERTRRRTADEAVTQLGQRVAELEQSDTATRERAARAEQATSDAVAARRRAEELAARAEAARIAALAERDQLVADLGATQAVIDAVASGSPLTRPPSSGVDAGRLRDALGAATSAVERLALALREATDAVPSAVAEPAYPAAPPTPEPAHAPRAGSSSRRAPRTTRARRVPVKLPGGVAADSPEAARFLVTVPEVLLIVDGYNAAKLGWPGRSLAEQRERLLDALDELVMRHGPEVQVVFDGADVPVPMVSARRRLTKVEFSPESRTADEVIVERVGALGIERPVVVATNDVEIRDATRTQGANLLRAEQLLGVARR